jgi:hypothetical protein
MYMLSDIMIICLTKLSLLLLLNVSLSLEPEDIVQLDPSDPTHVYAC